MRPETRLPSFKNGKGAVILRINTILEKAADFSESRPIKTLGKWMVRHHDVLAAEFARLYPAPPDWPALVDAFAENGITRSDGTAFKADTARRTWRRVQSNVTRARLRRDSSGGIQAKPPSPLPTPPPVAALPPVVQVPANAAECPTPRRPITFASPKTYPQEPK